MKKFLISAAALAVTIAPTAAPVAFMEGLSSNAVLYAKDADRCTPPASMAKMMTAYIAFDLIKQGKWKLDQRIEESVRFMDWGFRAWWSSQKMVSKGRKAEQRLPLVAAVDVGEAGFFGRAWAGLMSLFGA